MESALAAILPRGVVAEPQERPLGGMKPDP
jgi:hypothetical protein